MREDVESLDYDIDSSSIFEQDLQHQSAQFRRCQNAQRWAVCAAIGCTTGFVAFLIDVFTAQILQKKYAIAAAAMQYIPVGNDSRPFFAVMAAYVALSIVCVAVAAVLVVFVEPVAGGSGIPEVKTYLQGVKVPRLLRTTTLLCKAVGVVFSVSSGLVVGKEGPMIHAGSIVAAGLSQGSSKSCGWRTTCLRRFRNDHDKRDFVSAGAAAGVAAAFGAPNRGAEARARLIHTICACVWWPRGSDRGDALRDGGGGHVLVAAAHLARLLPHASRPRSAVRPREGCLECLLCAGGEPSSLIN